MEEFGEGVVGIKKEGGGGASPYENHGRGGGGGVCGNIVPRSQRRPLGVGEGGGGG